MERNLIQKTAELFLATFMLNAYFCFVNIPLILTMLTFRFLWQSLPFYALSLLFITPGLQALLTTIKTYDTGDIHDSLTKAFFKNYQNTFKDSFILGSLYWLMLGVLLSNLLFVHLMGLTLLIPFFMILMIVLMLHFCLMLLIHTTFIISKKDSLKLALHLMLKYPKQMMVLLFIFILGYFLIGTIPQISILFIFPIVSFLLLKSTKKMLQETMEMFDLK